MRILSWGEFDAAVASLALQAEAYGCQAIYGFPRGGLPLAVALSHKMGLPLAEHLGPHRLVVDDVFETGRTLSRARHLPGVLPVVWISKAEPTWWKAAEVVTSQEWLVFPWESLTAAQFDEESYRASRQ